MSETWRIIPGYPDYEVSDLGRVRSYRRGAPHILRPKVVRTYHTVDLYGGGDGKRRNNPFKVHRMVLLAFVGPCPADKPITRHLNGDPSDNRLSNLAYGTHSENEYDRVAHGTHNNARKTHCAQGHPYDAENTYVMPAHPNKRTCRTCRRARRAQYYEQRKGLAA